MGDCVRVQFLVRDTSHYVASQPGQLSVARDAKSSVSGGRLPYLEVHYGLSYGRTYLPFSPFTYGASDGDLYTHTGEAVALLLDRQVQHRLLIYAVLAQTRDVRETLHDCKHGELE